MTLNLDVPGDPPDPPKYGERGAVTITVFQVTQYAPGRPPHYEQIAQRFTIEDHPDGEDRPHSFMEALVAEGEIKAGTEYLVLTHSWKSHGIGEPMQYTDARTFTTRVVLTQI